jgi:predicted Fe-Mo cluster-binding NifX family protein
MKVALSVWKEDISTVFDSADQLLVLELDGADCRKQTVIRLNAADVLGRANQIKEKQIDVLICGAISRSLENALTSQGIRVYAFVRGSVEEVYAAYKKGELDQAIYALPGCQRRGNAGNRRCNRGKRRF